jgi:hypothetical protein
MQLSISRNSLNPDCFMHRVYYEYEHGSSLLPNSKEYNFACVHPLFERLLYHKIMKIPSHIRCKMWILARDREVPIERTSSEI